MSIKYSCPNCGKGLVAPDSMAGKKVKCINCGSVLVFPAAAPSPVAAAGPATPNRPPAASQDGAAGGKIFPESANLYDDMATILFDYYCQAARKIVAEEIRLEKEIASKKADLARLTSQSTSKTWLAYGLGGGAALLAVAGIFIHLLFLLAAGLAVGGVVFWFMYKQIIAKMRTTETAIEGFGQAHAAIRRDYKVHKLGFAYVPVASQIPFEEQSILIDHTGTVAPRDFNLYVVKRQEEFKETVRELETVLTQIPLVESAEAMEDFATDEHSRAIQSVPCYDYLGNLGRQMRSATTLLDDLDRISVSIPALEPSEPLAAFLKAHGTTDPGNAPVVNVFPTDAFDEQLGKFQALNDLRKSMESHTQEFEGFLQGLMTRLAATVQMVTRIKMGSTERIMEEANKLIFLSLKAGFNHYSPRLEADEIERIRNENFNYEDSVGNYRPFELRKSSQVLFDLVSENWVAEDGSRTSFPFGLLQIHEEIVAPIVQNLMEETRLERMRIYNHIKDQKLEYLNQWHRDTDDFYGRNRAEGGELINRMQTSLTDFTAAFNQFKAFDDTQKSMAATGSLDSSVVKSEDASATSVAAYAMQSQQFSQVQDEFAEYMERLKEEIDAKAVRFGHIEYYDASLRDGLIKRRSCAMTRSESLDNRRRPLLAIDPYFAESAELPPPPDLASAAHEAFGLNLPVMAAAAILRISQQKEAADGTL